MNYIQDISADARETMELIGDFSPTVRAEERMVKGYVDDGKCYLDSKELRKMSKHLVEVADWLDKRAGEAQQ